MNKKERDIQLIEACLLEKWWPMREGTFSGYRYRAEDTCTLCQYYVNGCRGCPIAAFTASEYCYTSPYDLYVKADSGSYDELFAIHLMCDFLVELLPITHPWRN